MPLQNGRLTPKERIAARVFAETGDAPYACRKAGYAEPHVYVRAHELVRKPGIMAEVRKQQAARLNNELLPLAVNMLARVLQDEKETTSNKIKAATLVFKHTLGEPGGSDEGKEPHEMTQAELNARIAKLRQEQAERTAVVIDGEVVPVERNENKGDVFG